MKLPAQMKTGDRATILIADRKMVVTICRRKKIEAPYSFVSLECRHGKRDIWEILIKNASGKRLHAVGKLAAIWERAMPILGVKVFKRPANLRTRKQKPWTAKRAKAHWAKLAATTYLKQSPNLKKK